MLSPYYKTKKSFQILNENYQSLAFTFSVENSQIDAEMNIYADDILIFSIINPIEDLQSPHLVPLFDCKSIYFEIKNVTCIFENLCLSEKKLNYLNAVFSTSKLQVINKICENVLFLLCDEKHVDILKICIKSLRCNLKTDKINLAIININDSYEVSEICKDNDAIEISCLLRENTSTHLAKGSVFTLGNSLLANKYIFLDVDTCTINDFSEIVFYDFDKIGFVSEWNDNDLNLIDLFESNKEIPDYDKDSTFLAKYLYGGIKKRHEAIVDYLKKLILQKSAINTGFFIANRKQLLRLQSKLEQINKHSIRYLDDEYVFREQAVANIAASHNNQIEILPNELNVQLFINSTPNRKKLIDNIDTDNKNKILHFNGIENKKLMRKALTGKFENQTYKKFKVDYCPIVNNENLKLKSFEILNLNLFDDYDFKSFAKFIGYVKLDKELLNEQKIQIYDFSQTNNYLLDDLEIIICVKIDSSDRLINLKKVVNHLNKHFKNQILIAEWGKESKINFEGNYKIENFDLNKNEFNRNLLANLIYKKTNKKIILNLDSDVILNPNAIVECYLKLKENNQIICMPHNGFCTWLSAKSTDNFINKNILPELWNDYFGFDSNLEKAIFFDNKYNYYNFKDKQLKHPGFAYMFDKEVFKKVGNENEYFVKHSHEDFERLIRFYKFGHEIFYSSFFCYHLYHSRKLENLWYFSNNDANLNEFEKIIKFKNIQELKLYIGTWPWNK